MFKKRSRGRKEFKSSMRSPACAVIGGAGICASSLGELAMENGWPPSETNWGAKSVMSGVLD